MCLDVREIHKKGGDSNEDAQEETATRKHAPAAQAEAAVHVPSAQQLRLRSQPPFTGSGERGILLLTPFLVYESNRKNM